MADFVIHLDPVHRQFTFQTACKSARRSNVTKFWRMCARAIGGGEGGGGCKCAVNEKLEKNQLKKSSNQTYERFSFVFSDKLPDGETLMEPYK